VHNLSFEDEFFLHVNRFDGCMTTRTWPIYSYIEVVKAAGDKLLMNKSIRQNFGGGLTLRNYIFNVWESIPLKLNRELEEWWKWNEVVFGLIDSASLRCYGLPKLRFCKTRLRVQVFSSWKRQHFLILPLVDQLNVYCVTTEADYRTSSSIKSWKLLNE